MNTTTEDEQIDLDSPKMRCALRRLRRTSNAFGVVCERIRAEADEVRRRDATPIPQLWPWDVLTRPLDEQEERAR